MSLRFSIDEALGKGWISKAEAEKQRAKARQKIPQTEPRKAPIDKKVAGKTAPAGKQELQKRLVCSIDGDMPQEKLWRACVHRWPQWVRDGRLVWEYPRAVPGRRYRLDIAFPGQRLACEVDGWQYHGKYLSDFKRDHERDRLLVINGWRVMRFYAGEIHEDRDALVEQIEQALNWSPC